jgi:hypothetical protein
MNASELESFIAGLSYQVEHLSGQDGNSYTVVRNFTPPTGSLAGQIFDVAFLRIMAEPYPFPAALHTRPALVPMNTAAPLATQASGIGPDWQYWSRRYDRVPTPRGIWTHILTIFSEVST